MSTQSKKPCFLNVRVIMRFSLIGAHDIRSDVHSDIESNRGDEADDFGLMADIESIVTGFVVPSGMKQGLPFASREMVLW